MREFKFRGKIIDHRTRFLKTLGYTVGDWIYGQNISVEPDDIDKDKTHVFICGIQVNPDTVGQFTGVTDSLGKEIYEGDILRDNDDWFDDPSYMLITYAPWKGKFYPFPTDWLDIEVAELYDVVGNMWDNPELYKLFPDPAVKGIDY